MKTTAEEEWAGCYKPHKWDKLRTKESIKHPAKMANGLLQRIFQHLISNDILKIGDTVLDPMGGIGTTAIGWCAMHPDNKAITVELEERFIELQKGNKRKAEEVLNRKFHWTILKGDARELSQILKDKGLIGVTSPPYSDTTLTSSSNFYSRHQKNRPKAKKNPQEGYSPDPNNIGNLPDKPVAVTSPPYGTMMSKPGGYHAEKMKGGMKQRKRDDWEYSKSQQNIGNLKDRPVALLSPPYADSVTGVGEGPNVPEFFKWAKEKAGKWPIPNDEMRKLSNEWQRNNKGYSSDPKNIGNLKDKGIVTVLSPPYGNIKMPPGIISRVRTLAKEGRWDEAIKLAREIEQEQKSKGKGFAGRTDEAIRRRIELALKMDEGNYSSSPDNIGNLKDRKPVAVTSPPYEGSKLAEDTEFYKNRIQGRGTVINPDQPSTPNIKQVSMGTGKTYLEAMLKVYHECSKVCRCIVTVTKNPTRKKKLRRLDLDTKKLLEAVGFDHIIWLKARLFDIIIKTDLKGNVTRTVKGRMSFFKRIQFEKGLPCAQHEDILIGMVK